MNNKYFKCRDGNPYTKYTKDEIYNLINEQDFETVKPFLKEMDYAYDEDCYYMLLNHHKTRVLGRFINTMRLWSYRIFGYDDWTNLKSS